MRRARKSRTPGPGAYTLPNQIGSTGSKFSFGSRTKSKLSLHRTPGPAAYNTTRHLSAGGWSRNKAPAFSFGSRIERTPRVVEPGPGAYNPRKPWHGGAVKFRSPIRMSYATDTPGPKYTPRLSSIQPNSPRFTFTSGRKPLVSRHHVTPGPGEYDVTLPKKPAFSFRGKFKPRFTADSPGPGAYYPVKPLGHKPKFHMGQRLHYYEY